MLIDASTVFFEDALKASTTSKIIGLGLCAKPGAMEPMPLRISVSEAFSAEEVQSLSISLEESATGDDESTWQAVPNASWNYSGADLASLGLRLGSRFLPRECTKPFLRLRFNLSPKSGKSISRGRIFAAILREDV